MLITRTQLGKELGISVKWVDESREKGRLPDYEPGTKLFDRAKALAAWEEWQAEANDEDLDSIEYLESVLRLRRSMTEISRQKVNKLRGETIHVGAVRMAYERHQIKARTNLLQFVEDAITRTLAIDNDAGVCKELLACALDTIERINSGEKTGDYIEESRTTRAVEPDLKKRIEREKTAYNHAEAELRELKAGIVKGEQMMLNHVEHILCTRAAIANSRLVAMPNEVSRDLVGKNEDGIRQRLLERVEWILAALPEWNLADLMDSETVSQYRSELTNQEEEK